MKVKTIYKLENNCEAQCPKCKDEKSFIPYINTTTNKPLNEKVGKCIYESKCGYHLKPKKFFKKLRKSQKDELPF